MEQSTNTLAPEAAADEPAFPATPAPVPRDPPDFAEPPLLSDCLGDMIDEALEDSFPADGRKPRHDGWTPEAMAGFLRQLAATGIVDHAARAVGLSATGAYAYRNRRQGRAFARMWDAVLVHRARARLAGELQARAIAGCVSVRKRDGEIVGEYHYYDNRLATALLTRLDRIAEREAASEAHLRTLSEDLDEFIDCLAEGGDADAFVEERRPVEQTPPPPAPEAAMPDDDPELTRFAHLAGCPDYRDVDPRDIEVRDLDPSEQGDWDDDQYVRAWRSGFMTWLEAAPGYARSPGAPLRFHILRMAARSAASAAPPDAAETAPPAPDPATIDDWTDADLAHSWRTRQLQRLPAAFWEDLADADEDDEPEA